MRKPLLKSMACLLIVAGIPAALADLVCAGSNDSPGRRPNVILVMTDDQGYGDLACYGNPFVETPHLDQLYAQSVRLVDFHVDPVCTPTRAALLTGRYSIRTGAWRTGAGRCLLRSDEVTIADVFSAAGYRTGMFGKWHLGDNYPYRPHDRGFHEAVWHQHGAIGMSADSWGNDYIDDIYQRNGEHEQFTGYCTDVFFDEALKFMEEDRDKPFFVYLSTNAPHNPYTVPEQYSAPYQSQGLSIPLANFLGMMTNIDENVGRLMRKLKQWDLQDNTILIFMTDNGALGGIRMKKGDANGFPLKPWDSFGADMRGRKGSPYEGGHRVPFFIRWPHGSLTGGKDLTGLTAHIDVMPTLIEFCGLESPSAVEFDGISLAPLLREQASVSERTLFVEHLGGSYGQPTFEIRPYEISAVLTSRWRLVFGKELYDINHDPMQRTNVAAHHPQIVAKLRKAHDRWFSDVSRRISEPCRIVLGDEAENPMRLNLQDWYTAKGNPPWYQRGYGPFPHVGSPPAPYVNGSRLVEVPGTGQFGPYSYVGSTPAPHVNGKWMVEVARAGQYEITLRQLPTEANCPIQAADARIKIGNVDEAKEVAEGATAVTFTVQLGTGEQSLQTWFTETDGKSRGAFYVYVRYLSG